MIQPIALVLLLVAAKATGDLAAGPVEKVAAGFQFLEGPVWLPEGQLVFSDIPADTIYRADKSIFRHPSAKSNGLTLDKEGRLLACEHQAQRVTRTEKDGSITVVADRFMGRKFNSPNDVVVRSDGTIFFTDPPYGLEGRKPELPFPGVYAVAPDRKISLVLVYFKFPNGLVFSLDEKTLYIGDAEASEVQAYAVAPDGALSNGRVFCKPPRPDGMRIDVNGHVWIACKDGIHVYDASGRELGFFSVPEPASNCAFGGPEGKTLYITAVHGLYKLECTAQGVLPGIPRK